MFMWKIKKSVRLRNRDTQSGSVTIEFALLFPLFAGLMFSICEAALFHYSTTVIEETVSKASRKIRTGQAMIAQDPTASDACSSEKACFFEEVCDTLSKFGSCQENLSIDVTKFDSWSALNSDLSNPVCANSDEYDVESMPFVRGDQLEIIRVRVCFTLKTINPGLGMSLAKTEDGKRALISTYVFRNEPYSDGLDNEDRPS